MKTILLTLIFSVFISCSPSGRIKAFVGMCIKDTTANPNISKILEIHNKENGHSYILTQWLRAGDENMEGVRPISLPYFSQGYYQVECPQS